MELALLTIFLAVSIPAWGFALMKEHAENKRSVRESDALENEVRTAKELLTPPPDVIRDVKAMFPHFKRAPDLYDKEFARWFYTLRKWYFEDCGLAEDFAAIYGETWKEDARFLPSEAPGDYGYKWVLKGFHNSPIGENLTLRWPEKKAVEALLYAKRGFLPPDPVGTWPHVNIFPYSYTDWNKCIGTAWYKRIEELLRQAGKPVTAYFYRKADQSKDGAYFACLPGTDRRW